MSQLPITEFGLFGDIQEAIKTRLAESEQLTGITVITEMQGDLENVIQRAVNRQGILVEVMTPTASQAIVQSGSTVYLQKIPVIVQITERPLVNRGATGTRKPGLLLVQYVLSLLNNYAPDGLAPIVIDDPPFAEVPVPELSDEYRLWNVNFWTHGGWNL
jgi:hypothetical protein